MNDVSRELYIVAGGVVELLIEQDDQLDFIESTRSAGQVGYGCMFAMLASGNVLPSATCYNSLQLICIMVVAPVMRVCNLVSSVGMQACCS